MPWFRILVYASITLASIGILVAAIMGQWTVVTWLGWSMFPLWLLTRYFVYHESDQHPRK